MKRTKAARDSELAELARSHTRAALDALVEVARSGKGEAARVSAAAAILLRGHGPPALGVGAEGPVDYQALSDEEIDARIAAHELLNPSRNGEGDRDA